MRRVLCVLGAVLVSAQGIGCGGSQACADLGDDVLLTAQVTDNGERARVEVELRRPDLEDGSIPVKLCEDHGLRVDDVDMTEVKRPSGAVIYEAELSAVSGQQALARRFELRTDDARTEFTARIDAPGFAITSPMADSELSRAAPLTITWDPPRGGEAKIAVKVADEIDGDACLGEPIELEEPDDGEVVVGASQVELTPKMPPSDGVCEAFVTLSRTHSAPLELVDGSGGLHPDSRVEATTSRTVAFVSVP
ncbi:MAG TPA: hypothetical protein VGB85_13770 [Nannocystis sp.]|jgi:hypothetical protein